MRVMLVVNEFPPEKIAGTAMATQALAEHLAARGHQILVVVTTDCPAHLQDQLVVKGYELTWLKPRPFRGLGGIWRIWNTWREAKRFSPQVIQGQAVSCGLIAAVVGHLLGLPSICYAQGYDVYQATWLQQKTEIRWGCSWVTRLLAVTEDLAAHIQCVVSLPPISILPHAFELPDHTLGRKTLRQQYGLSEKHTLVFSVGRLERFKGHDVLLHAWSKCVLVNSHAQLWIAGMGSEQERLQALAEKLDIQDSVKFVGYLSKDEVHQMMEAADLFALPSRSEPFGIVLLEAMAHALPVVASEVGGIPEVVPDNSDVQLVPADDVEALANAMLEYMQHPFVAAIESRQHAMEFEWHKQVERFESIYAQLLR